MIDIKSIIRNIGPISISAFMQEVMFSPSRGYYKTKNPIGDKQDFITAPEISSIFSQLIAGYFFSIFTQKSDQKITFVEMGAGLGTMFYDILQTFQALASKIENGSQIISNIEFVIIEKNPVLIKIQQKKLAPLDLKTSWFNNFDDFEAKNSDRSIYFVANELFDCFAINQFSWSDGKWQEILLDLDQNENLIPTLEAFNEAKHRLIDSLFPSSQQQLRSSDSCLSPRLQGGREKKILEHSFESENFMKQLSSAIKKTSGMGLIIDYGYIESPLKSTLQAIKNHQKVNIFEEKDPYSCDLTSLVNFKALQRSAEQENLQTSLITQSQFLISLGIEEKKSYSENLDLAIDRLTSPEQMGELFKCLIVW